MWEVRLVVVAAGVEVIGEADPSITGIDRSNWSRTDIVVPVDGIAHNPTYRWLDQHPDHTARLRGQYPTAESALGRIRTYAHGSGGRCSIP